MAGFKYGAEVGGTYRTEDGFNYRIVAETPDDCRVGVRVNSQSQRLFYPDGQYVGSGNGRDIIGYASSHPTA